MRKGKDNGFWQVLGVSAVWLTACYLTYGVGYASAVAEITGTCTKSGVVYYEGNFVNCVEGNLAGDLNASRTMP